MTDTYRAKSYLTKQELDIEATGVLPIANSFRQLSDKLWARRDKQSELTFHTEPAIVSAADARDALNEVISSIDRSMIVSGADRTIELPGYAPDHHVTLGPDVFALPDVVRVGTYNWDKYNGVARMAEVDGVQQPVEFIDGHVDYSRLIFAGLGFQTPGGSNSLRYAVLRNEAQQDQTTELTLDLWTSELAEQGYEGGQIASCSISESQEYLFLELVQKLGGVSIE